MKQTLEWFIQRVGNKVYRDAIPSDNIFSKKLGSTPVIIRDELHAQYLFDIQNDFIADGVNLNYRDTREK